MTPTADRFHALARSSPWRWSRLHMGHRSERWNGVEAWVVRPGWLLVRAPGLPEQVETGVPYSVSPLRRSPLSPQDVTPDLRADGLVASRPRSDEVWYDDPMFAGAGLTWVAMLDPVELSHDVEVSDLVAEERHGRPALEGDRDPWLENDLVAVDQEVVVPEGHQPRAVRGADTVAP